MRYSNLDDNLTLSFKFNFNSNFCQKIFPPHFPYFNFRLEGGVDDFCPLPHFKIEILPMYPNYRKYVEHSYNVSAVHPFLYKTEEKIIKVGTIILISYMAMTCKIIAMFTISMGALALKVTLLIYGWMSTPVVLVTGGLIQLVKINKIISAVVFTKTPSWGFWQLVPMQE